MTGPDHYREAEHLLMQADDGAADWEPIVAAAQVHATLASVHAHNRAITELNGLLHTMLDQIRELHEDGERP